MLLSRKWAFSLALMPQTSTSLTKTLPPLGRRMPEIQIRRSRYGGTGAGRSASAEHEPDKRYERRHQKQPKDHLHAHVHLGTGAGFTPIVVALDHGIFLGDPLGLVLFLSCSSARGFDPDQSLCNG